MQQNLDLFGAPIGTTPQKPDWVGGKHSIFVSLGASNHTAEERAANDYYATPPEAVEMLMRLETFRDSILEPCVGGGHIARVLEQHGKKVLARDIVDRGFPNTTVADFVACEDKGLDVDVITNPPYNFALDFCKKSLDVIADGCKVALFLKLSFAEGKARRKFFDENPPVRVWVSSSRLTCGKNGVKWDPSAVCYAWWIWVKGCKGPTEMKWFN